MVRMRKCKELHKEGLDTGKNCSSSLRAEVVTNEQSTLNLL